MWRVRRGAAAAGDVLPALRGGGGRGFESHGDQRGAARRRGRARPGWRGASGEWRRRRSRPAAWRRGWATRLRRGTRHATHFGGRGALAEDFHLEQRAIVARVVIARAIRGRDDPGGSLPDRVAPGQRRDGGGLSRRGFEAEPGRGAEVSAGGDERGRSGARTFLPGSAASARNIA